MITIKEISYSCLVVVILASSKQISAQCGDNNKYCPPDTCCPLGDTCCSMQGSPNGVGCCPIENVREWKFWPFWTDLSTCHCHDFSFHVVLQIIVTFLTICLRITFYSLFVGSLLWRWVILLLPRLHMHRKWSLLCNKTCGYQHDPHRRRTFDSWRTNSTLRKLVISYLPVKYLIYTQI